MLVEYITNLVAKLTLPIWIRLKVRVANILCLSGTVTKLAARLN